MSPTKIPTQIPTIVVGPSSPVGEQPSFASRVHRLAQQPHRSSCTPAYHLGRTAETWLAALSRRDEPTVSFGRQAA